ncbi:MAG TPA: hypothetical protein VII58_09400 [Acidobacteriaceae bacterium]
MSAQQIVKEFLGDVREFNKAMDGPSGDAEADAACAMRDTAIAMAQVLGMQDPEIASLLAAFDSEEPEDLVADEE